MSHVKDVYLLQWAGPKNQDAITTVKCPQDLEIEIIGALVEGEEPRNRTQAFLPQIFEESVPHMKSHRLVILRLGLLVQELAMKLWNGGRMFLKKLDNDERISFEKFEGGTQTRAPDHVLPTGLAGVVITWSIQPPLDTL